MKLSKKTQAYLCLIGKAEEASVQLARKFAKQADELRAAGLAVYPNLTGRMPRCPDSKGIGPARRNSAVASKKRGRAIDDQP
jgi:hypothetical protein